MERVFRITESALTELLEEAHQAGTEACQFVDLPNYFDGDIWTLDHAIGKLDRPGLDTTPSGFKDGIIEETSQVNN